MRIVTTMALALLVLSAAPARAQGRGEGSGRNSTTPPVTRGSGAAEAASAPDASPDPRHGFMGGRGAAPDAAWPARLGVGVGGETYETGKSGDRVRSASSADVRSARQQQAPDLEWASDGRSRPSGGDTRLQPQTPFGMKSQEGEQKQPKR